MKKPGYYWLLQLTGWSIFIILNLIFYSAQNEVNYQEIIYHILLIPSGIFITHQYRRIIIRFNWLKKSTVTQIILALISSSLAGIMFFIFQYFINALVYQSLSEIQLLQALANILNFSFVFIFWSLIYFSFHFLNNYKKSEIQTLKWQANIKEIELNKIKSQLNPHFMFNALNSIRALIAENPDKARDAVSALSNILRSTLVLEQNKLIPFTEELKIVSDYLELEKIRFEERLTYSLHADACARDYQVPPLLLQTLVENGIKHGISKLTTGGKIELQTVCKDSGMEIIISNSGNYSSEQKSETGLGLRNINDRLENAFGKSAYFSIRNTENDTVTAKVFIPKFIHK